MNTYIAFAVFVVGLGACGGETKSSQSIGAAGGSLTNADGIKLDVPSGALTADTTISMTKTDGLAAPSSTTLVGSAYTFGPEGTQFAKPVEITMVVTPSQLPQGASMQSVVIYTAPAGSTSYTALETSVVDSTHVKASTSHFSVFVPVVAMDPTTDHTSNDAGSTSGCTPSCKPTETGCACTATCGGKTYQLICGSTGGCYCETDGQTGNAVDASCDNTSYLVQLFSSPTNQNGCGFPAN